MIWFYVAIGAMAFIVAYNTGLYFFCRGAAKAQPHTFPSELPQSMGEYIVEEKC